VANLEYFINFAQLVINKSRITGSNDKNYHTCSDISGNCRNWFKSL
jgi:hypothetical protein